MTKIFLFALMAVTLMSPPARAARLPALKMLSTTTCPACKMMEPVIKDLEEKYKGKLTVEHVYLEEHPEVAKQYNVRYVPTLIYLDAGGKEVAQEVGYKSLDEVLQTFTRAGVKVR